MLHGRPHPISPMINYSNLLLQTLRLIFLNFQKQKSQTAPAKLRNYPAPPAPKTPQKAPPVKGPPGGSVAAASPAPPPGLTKNISSLCLDFLMCLSKNGTSTTWRIYIGAWFLFFGGACKSQPTAICKI